MARSIAQQTATGLTNLNKHVPVQYADPIGNLPEEIAPSTVRNKLRMASSAGYLGGLHILYKQMLSDARYAGLRKSLQSSVALCPLNISQGKKGNRASKLAYNLIKEQFTKINKVRTIKQMTDPYFMGTSVNGILWDLMPSSHTTNDTAWFRGLKSLDPARLYVGVDPQNENEYQKLLVSSIEFPEGKPVTEFEPGSIIWADDGDTDEGYYHLAGAARRCLGWWLGKLYSQSYWSEFNETFAEPIRIAYVDQEASRKERLQLEKFLKFLGRNMYGIFDDSTDIDLMEANKLGTVTTFREFIQLANEEISIAINGEIESSGSANKFGSNAKAETHLKVRSNIVGTVVEDTNEQISEIRDHILRLNIDPEMEEDEKPIMGLQLPRPEDKETLSRFYDNVTSYIEVPAKQIRRDLELMEAEDGEETIGPKDRSNGLQPAGASNKVPAKEPAEDDREPISEGSKKTDS